MFKTRFISLLVLLMTAVSGAWAQTERLLTTITATGKDSYSETTPGVVTVVTQNCADFDNDYGWLWYSEGSVTVKANEGYTITKCVFSQPEDKTVTVSKAPFKGNFIYNDDCESYIWEGTDPEYGKMDGVLSIDVYGYARVTLTDGDAITGLDTYKEQEIWVNYTRSFTADKPSTVCLPFAYTKKTGDGSFYEFTGIEKVGSEYIATMTEPGTSTLTANRPYLYKAKTTGVTDFSGTYTIPASIEAGTITSGDWTFKGTYSTIQWPPAPTKPTYGFSAQDTNDGITQGQFVKVGSYVRIKPMRAYLEYNGSDSQFANARALTRAAAPAGDNTLPETIGVRLISANGEVNAIGTLHTRTGEVSFDSEAWYTLDGKRLSTQPNTKGIYVNNGKKVVIK